ncbi:MAG: CBS domain-containing protein [Ectothiorhodospiraceae bacterium]|nr:CBS domain-containing protein [Ectothiorhodospiraceae bacterium]
MFDFIQYKVSDVMVGNPVTVNASATVTEAQSLFQQHGFNGLPVVDAEGRLTGLVTKLDILRAFTLRPDAMIPRYEEIMQLPVSRIMISAPVSVTPETPLTRVLQRLVDMGVKSLPVVSDGQLVGVVAREDVLHALQKATSGT